MNALATIRTVSVCLTVTSAALLSPRAAPAAATSTDLPTIEGRRAVASVNGEPIALQELVSEIGRMHEGHGADQKAGRKQNPTAVLDRMVTARLVAQEARNAGIDKLPETKAKFESFRLDALRDVLVQDVIAKAGPPDAAAVDRIYKGLVREYRLKSILVPHEADAKELERAVKAGGDFEKLAAALVASKRAQEGDSAEWMSPDALQPGIDALLSRMKPGTVGPLVRIGSSWTMFKILELRHPEDAAAHERARGVAAEEKRTQAIADFSASLRARYATIDSALLKAIDFEAPGGWEKANKDRRAVAQVKGGEPVTGADLAAGMEQKFFHGIEKAIAGKKVNQEKQAVLENVLNKRVILNEAQRIGLEQTPAFKDLVARQRAGYLFSAYVQKAIVPGIKVEDAEIAAHYEAHKSELMGSETLNLDSIAFTSRQDAEEALQKLQRGADLDWMKSHSRGLADPEAAAAALDLGTGGVALLSLPEDAQKALKGASKGDFRLYSATPVGPHFVLVVREFDAAKPVPISVVREGIRRKVFSEKLNQQIDDLGAKLRKGSDVKVFATGDALTSIVTKHVGAGA